MIGRIKGIILDKTPPEVLIDVAGVAYEVLVSMTTFYRLPAMNENVILLTHFVVREDSQQLYGFAEVNERLLFRNLIKVNGIGPRMALTILSSIEPDSFVQSIMNNDTSRLVKLPGVGKKTAERLIIEMRDRLNDWCVNKFEMNISSDKPQSIELKSTAQDAISALISLGYKSQEAVRVITMLNTESADISEIIRQALKILSK
ncbi:MAG: Holliday junction ATP-dependent DNA helicase RuvA [Legionellaceae bacterium]